jgi:hypothetical protein
MNRTFCAVLCTSMALGPCATAETRNLAPLNAVALNGIGTVRIKQGPQAVTVNIDPELADRYVTEVKNDKLSIGFKCTLRPSVLRAMKNLKHCTVDISVPNLSAIETNGECSIEVDGFAWKEFSVSATGEGTILLAGAADTLDVSCTGAAKVDAFGLAAKDVRARLTGAATLRANATALLDASISGAGTVVYRGEPRISQRISGAGKIRKDE